MLVIMISMSEPDCWPIWKKMMVISCVAESITVTKAVTMKMVATPTLYEKLFFVCVWYTLCRMVSRELHLVTLKSLMKTSSSR